MKELLIGAVSLLGSVAFLVFVIAISPEPKEPTGKRCYEVSDLSVFGQSGGSGIGPGAHEFKGYGATWLKKYEDGEITRDSCDLCSDTEAPLEGSKWCELTYD